MKHGLDSHTNTALAALVISCLTTLAAASEPTPPEGFAPTSGTTDTGGSADACGTCQEDNGRGIYVVELGSHCIPFYAQKNIMSFCPEAFIETQDSTGSKLELVGLQFTSGKESSKSIKLSAQYNGKPVIGVDTKKSELTFYYQDSASNPRVPVPQGALSQLVFALEGTPGPMLINFSRATAQPSPVGLPRYTGTWRAKNEPQRNGSLCEPALSAEPKGTLSVLPSKRVSGVNGKVTDQSNAATVGCASGAIVTCMDWKYGPSLPSPTKTPAQLQKENALLGACIQAKRAAYKGGAQSYTRSGTPIALKDNQGIKNDPFAQDSTQAQVLEAIWTENGAACLNLQNRRAPQVPFTKPVWLNECPADAGSWWTKGIIATGHPLPQP